MALCEDDDLSGEIDPYQHDDDAWTEWIPDNISMLADRWSLIPGEELKAGYVGYLVDCERNDGSRVVLKLRNPNFNAQAESQALQNFDGNGTVRLLEADEEIGAILLERVLPGDTLLSMISEVDEDDAIAKVIAELPNVPATGTLRSGQQQLETWAAWLIEEAPTGSRVPTDQFQAAGEFLREFAPSQSTGTPITVHGDVHVGNVLAAGNNSWCAIDPKGFSGNRAFDLGWYVSDPSENKSRHMTESVARRLDRLTAACEFDRFELAAFGHAVSAVKLFARIKTHSAWDIPRFEDWTNAIWEVELAGKH